MDEIKAAVEADLARKRTTSQQPVVSRDTSGIVARRYFVYQYAGPGVGCGWAWIGALWAGMALMSLMADDWRFGVGAVTVITLPFALRYAWGLLSIVDEVVVRSDGSIELVSEWRRRTVRASDIRRVRGIRQMGYNGRVSWEMKIDHGARRAIKVDHFDEARQFINDLRALNPYIEVSGEWPSIGYPERR
jgi:hypothetical protein